MSGRPARGEETATSRADESGGRGHLTRTCIQYRVSLLPYLTDVLGKLASGWDMTRLDELLPHRWRTLEAASENAQGP